MVPRPEFEPYDETDVPIGRVELDKRIAPIVKVIADMARRLSEIESSEPASRHLRPVNDGSGLYDRVKCPQCLGTGGPSAGPACTLCKGAGTVNAVIVDQMARMSKS